MLQSIEKSDSWSAFLAQYGAHFDEGQRVTAFDTQSTHALASASGAALVPLTHLGIIRVSGDDAAQFLQSQVTNDMREVSLGSAQFGGYCTPKGRLLATFVVMCMRNAYLLLLPRELAASVADRLRKFVLRAKVSIDTALDSMVVLGVAGPGSAAAVRDSLAMVADRPMSVVNSHGISVVRLPADCLLIVADEPEGRTAWKRLADLVKPAGAAAWEWRQVRAGLATVLPPTQEAFLPQMLNMHLYGGVGFQKGCYPGQEIVARTHYLGDLKRALYLGRCRVAPAPGDAVIRGEGNGEVAGTVVNAALSPDGGWEFLAVLSRESISGPLRLRVPAATQETLISDLSPAGTPQ